MEHPNKGLLPTRFPSGKAPALATYTMKSIILITAIISIFYLINISYASVQESLNPGEKLMLEGPFLEIFEKVVKFLKGNPDKNHLSLKGFLEEGVINKDDYDFIVNNKIKYNPPTSAGPHDNYLSIFDRENEDGTSSHILYDLVDKTDPNIIKIGKLSDLNAYLAEWFEYSSAKKSLSLFKNKEFYYFTLCYWDNDYWDKQHAMLIDLPIKDVDTIKKFKTMMNSQNLSFKENTYQDSLNLTVLLPSKLSLINKFSMDILTDIFLVPSDGIVNYTPDGFRFKEGQINN